MILDRLMPWFNLAMGVLMIVLASRRRPGRILGVVAACMYLSVGVAALTSGWMRGTAWGIAAVAGVVMAVQMARARDRVSQFIVLIFYPVIVLIAVTELVADDLSRMQQLLFGAVAVLALATIAVALMRVIRPRRERLSGQA